MNLTFNIQKLTKDEVDFFTQDNPNIISAIRDEILKNAGKQYDDLVFKLLEPYEITRENCMENLGRVNIYRTSSDRDHFYVDRKYAFTINHYTLDIDPDKLTCLLRIEPEIDERLVGDEV